MLKNYVLSLKDDVADAPLQRAGNVVIKREEQPAADTSDTRDAVKSILTPGSRAIFMERRDYDPTVLPDSEGVLKAETENVVRVPGYIGQVVAKGSSFKYNGVAPKMHNVTSLPIGPRAVLASEAETMASDKTGGVLVQKCLIVDSEGLGKGFDGRLKDSIDISKDAVKTRFDLKMQNGPTRDTDSDSDADSNLDDNTGKFEIGDTFHIKLKDLNIGGYDSDSMDYSLDQEPALLRRKKFLEKLCADLGKQLNADVFEGGDKNVLFDIEIDDEGFLVVKTQDPDTFRRLMRAIRKAPGQIVSFFKTARETYRKLRKGKEQG